MMTLLFGQSISSFSNLGGSPGSGGMDVDAAQRFRSDIDRFVLYFIYLFAARFVVGYVATLCVCVAAARTTNALRKAFLEGLLRREVADLDVADSGSAATQVTTSELSMVYCFRNVVPKCSQRLRRFLCWSLLIVSWRGHTTL